jgi:hypothetical protein
VSPVKYELGFYIPEDDILHSNRHENLKSYTISIVFAACIMMCVTCSGLGVAPHATPTVTKNQYYGKERTASDTEYPHVELRLPQVNTHDGVMTIRLRARDHTTRRY